MDRAFEQARLDAVKLQIVALDAAISAFLSDESIQNYTVNTGQTVTTVNRAQLASLQQTQSRLENKYAVLCQRLTGDGTHQAVSGC